MRVVVTGAGGFIGRALVQALLHEGRHEVTTVDVVQHADSGLAQHLVGDICDPEFVARIFLQPCDALVHLATVPGGTAEIERSLAERVNLNATLALIEAAKVTSKPPRVVFASSIAVYGDLTQGPISDESPLTPSTIYGGQKAMTETWIATLTRRGEIDGISLRLPGIIARPQGPSGMQSAFMSNLFHAARAGDRFTAPVSPAATMWLMSGPCVVRNLLHALTMDTSHLHVSRALALPNIRVSMEELVSVIARAAPCAPDFVDYMPDHALEATFGRLPEHRFEHARTVGFCDDGDTLQLVKNAFSCI